MVVYVNDYPIVETADATALYSVAFHKDGDLKTIRCHRDNPDAITIWKPLVGSEQWVGRDYCNPFTHLLKGQPQGHRRAQ